VLGLTADWEVGRTLPPRFLYKSAREELFVLVCCVGRLSRLHFATCFGHVLPV
jgi:hypothetical protein